MIRKKILQKRYLKGEVNRARAQQEQVTTEKWRISTYR